MKLSLYLSFFMKLLQIALAYFAGGDTYTGTIPIGQFWNGFIGKYTRESMERWVKAFVGFRNCTKDLKRVLS